MSDGNKPTSYTVAVWPLGVQYMFWVLLLNISFCRSISVMQIMLNLFKNYIKTFYYETTNPNETKGDSNGLWVVHFRKCRSLLKIYFFIDQLLFYRKSKLFRSQTTSAGEWVVQHILRVFFLWNFSFNRFIPIMQILFCMLIQITIYYSETVYLNETKLDIGMFLGCSPFKEYLKFLNRLYDITWFGAVYA